MSQVDVLYRLQQIDDEIRQSTKRLGAIALLLKGTDALARAKEERGAAENDLQEWRAMQTDLGLELRSLNEKARNDVSTPAPSPTPRSWPTCNMNLSRLAGGGSTWKTSS